MIKKREEGDRDEGEAKAEMNQLHFLMKKKETQKREAKVNHDFQNLIYLIVHFFGALLLSIWLQLNVRQQMVTKFDPN